jgi:hypothetical protein
LPPAGDDFGELFEQRLGHGNPLSFSIELSIQQKTEQRFNQAIEVRFKFSRMNEKAQFAERLKAAMQDAGYEPRSSVLEREFNLRYWGRPVTFQAVRRWLRGDSLPEQDKLLVLAEWLQVEPQVLRYGEGAAQRIQETRNRWEQAVAGEEREVMQAYLDLPAEQRKIIREVILAFAKSTSVEASAKNGRKS